MKTELMRKVRVALTPPSTLLRTRLSNGAIVAGYNRPGHGGRGIYIYGDSLEPELSALGRFLRPGFVFVDIGANVGVYSMKAAKEVGPGGLVLAIEPFMDSARQLFRNAQTNRFHNVRVRNFCVGRATEPAELYLNGGKPNSFSLLSDGAADSVSVLSVSLDDLCRWEGLTRLDYLKIDAEGAEQMILAGGMESIRRFRPIIQVEIAISNSETPDHYLRFSAPGQLNNVFIPKENRDALHAARSLGWTS
jgi:FkbM family methyltransferase